jgi:hypothetical protein
MRRTRSLGVLVTLVLALQAAPSAGAPGDEYSEPIKTAIGDLAGRTEVRTGYDRDKFVHWVDEDGDGCNTRREVLIQETDDPLSVGARCTLNGGRWFSFYDRKSWTDSGRIDIDHMVPLAEAWDSGARNWTKAERRAFANDLGDTRSLVGVTDSVNQAKGDKDPAEWLPEFGRCRYVRMWVSVKIRWRLTIDKAERATLKDLAADCPDAVVTVTRAR